MNTPKESDLFFDKLEKHPKLRKRFDEILNIAENSSGELVTADEAEMKAIEEVRKLGQEVMREWAENQHKKQNEEFTNKHKSRQHIKKNSTGKRRLDE